MIITGTSGNDTGFSALLGTNFADTINGLAGNDQLYGEDGNDILVGGLGNDQIHGDHNTDTVSYLYSASGVAVDLGQGVANGAAGDSDTLLEVEVVWGSNHGD